MVAAARVALPSTRSGGVRICVTPAGAPGAIRQQTIVNDETVLEETIAADGQDHAVAEAACRGTRSAQWSSTGRQLFMRGTLSCEGQPTRTISGLTMIVAGPTWVDVQLVEVGGQRNVRVRRYGMSRDQSGTAGRRTVTPGSSSGIVTRLAIEEVTEASREVAPEVVQAALVEVGTKFPLNAERLIALDKAGVPGSVVDVMVALSFPEKFVIERRASGGYAPMWGGGGPDPWAVSSPYGWVGMYSPFAYQYYGFYDPRFGPGYGWITVNPGPGAGEPEEAHGRAVRGQGYTRVSPRQPDPVRVNAGGVVDRSGAGAPSGTGGSGSSGSGGDSGVSSGGYSGGGSSGSGRTAQPRPPGGPGIN